MDAPEDRLDSLNRLVGQLYVEGRYEEALEPAQEALQIARAQYENGYPEVAIALNNLAELYRGTGAYARAKQLFDEALTLTRNGAGHRDPAVADVLTNLAALHCELGEYGAAEPLHREALGIRREAPGRDVEVAYSLNNLAEVHRQRGEYAAAEPLYREAIDIHRKEQGDGHQDLAAPLNNLATLHRDLGDYRTAASLYGESLAIRRQRPRDRDADVARTLNNLGAVLHDMGEYARAEPMYREALASRQRTMGERHPDVAQTLGNIAGLRSDLGDDEEAESLYREALAIDRGWWGDRHPKVAIDLGNLAGLRRKRGDHASAASLYEQALAVYEATLGPGHPTIAIGLANFAATKLDMKDYAAAISLYREALSIHRKAVGDHHPFVAQDLNNLAAAHQMIGDHGSAEPLYEEALSIRRHALGPGHPLVAWTLANLAVLCVATGRDERGLGLLLDAAGIDDGVLAKVLALGSERQRLIFLESIRDLGHFLLSLVLGRFLGDRAVLADAFDLVLRRKGVAADVLVAQRDAVLGGRHPALAARLRELTALRMRIAAQTLAGPGPEGFDEHGRLLAEWEREKESIEAELAGAIPEMRLEERLQEAGRAAVAAALPPEAILVEFVRFDDFDFHAVPARDDPQWKPARYLAFVLAAGDPDGIAMVDLGEAAPIDALIASYRTAVTGQGRSRTIEGTASDAAAPGAAEHTAGAALREAVFEPLVPALEGRTRVFLAPDGDLTRLPFEVLPSGDGRRLIEDYAFTYLSTGRDVLRFEQPREEAGLPLIAAGPDFDLGDALPRGPSPARHSRDLDPGGLHFDPLAGTEEEGERIGMLLGTAPWLREEVLEASLKAAISPRILHVATHGFFLHDQERGAAQALLRSPPGEETGPLRGPGMENPLLRSGLALAGANTFLDGRTPPPEAEDGLLTAEDVSGLDLLGTEMVVLSACETGLGEVRVGEGVFGLRRAFVLAGAKTLVMSLWKVPDGPSAELMQAFYENLKDGMGRAEALREAQLAMAEVYPPPWFWGAFICQGDPGPLELSGKTG